MILATSLTSNNILTPTNREAIEGYALCLEDDGMEFPVHSFDAFLLAI